MSEDRMPVVRRGYGPTLLLRPRAEDRALLWRANSLFGGYHIGASQSEALTDAVRAYGKPLLVDPQTNIFSVPPGRHFQKDPETGRRWLRNSSDSLATAYGEPFASVVGVRRIGPEDFEAAARTSVARVIGYQRERLLGQMGLPLLQYYDKYRLWDEEAGRSGVPNQILLPPYFYFRHRADPWFDVNLRLAELALELKGPQERVFPVLLFSRALLDDVDVLDAVADAYVSIPADGYFLWPDGFDETREPVERLRAICRLVSRLAESGRRVSKLYGGYWSVLLGPRGLSEFSCGLGYWSSRNAFAYGGRGGKTIKNFYIPELRQAVSFDDAARILEAEPRLVCRCSVCAETYGARVDEFGAMRDGARCEAHFLQVRTEEMARVAEDGTAGALRGLAETRQLLKSSRVQTGYLDVWARALAA